MFVVVFVVNNNNKQTNILILEYETVHGRILAVNMAHLRKKRHMAENNSLEEQVFHGIQEANRGKKGVTPILMATNQQIFYLH